MIEKLKKYILFYFSESLYQNYHSFLSIDDLKRCINKAKSFDFELNSNKAILNIYEDANILNVKKINEIKRMCSIFDEDHFFFLSPENEKGVCFKFPLNFKIINEAKSEQSFYSFLSMYNYWLSDNWCRIVNGGVLGDLRIKNGRYIDFSHEIIVTKNNDLYKIKEIYENNYGIITPILDHKDFFEDIFGHEFKNLLTKNIYITEGSLIFLKNQIFN